MQRLKKFAVGVVVFSALATIGTLMWPSEAVGQNPPPGAPVEIVAPIPVPVRVTSLPEVSARQNGPWTMAVTNSAASPLFVRTPVKTPFLWNLNGLINTQADYHVPPGKQLVLLDLDMTVECKHGERPYLFYLLQNGGLGSVRPLADTITTPSPLDKSQDLVRASRHVELYLNPGDRFSCSVRSANYETVHGSYGCVLSGYMIDLP